MGEHIKLVASDGAVIGAYVAKPTGPAKGGMVVIQEIFGVNSHIRSVVDFYATQGYLAIAPALFDRAAPGTELGYDSNGIQKGIELMGKGGDATAELDVQEAINHVSPAGKVGLVGYCWGGTIAYRAALHLTGLSAAVGYYGGGVAALSAEQPKIPVMLHFGDQDHSIPLNDVEQIKAARPEIPVFVYPAGHGFNCDLRGSYNKEAAEVATTRTLEFFGRNL